MSKKLFTIGYEGRTPAALADVLKKNAVEVVVDVRFLPLSHKRGFSKTALGEFLARQGIQYQSMKKLGTPPEMRRRYKQDGDFPALAARYRKYLAGQDCALQALRDLALKQRCCLLCFEGDPAKCHRSVLADVVLRRPGRRLAAKHL
jgi:uncharacterized protein (DUF488 family)